MLNFLRILCIIIFFGLLTACGGGGGGSSSATPSSPTSLDITSPEFSALHVLDNRRSSWFIVARTSDVGERDTIFGQNVYLQRQIVSFVQIPLEMMVTTRFNGVVMTNAFRLRAIDANHWHANDGDVQFAQLDGIPGHVGDGLAQILVERRQDITTFVRLCPARWLGDYININFPNPDGTMICAYPSGSSYSPDMRRVVYAAMSDGFNRGVAIGESGFAFSGRYDNNDRAAGFTYDMGSYALRTDYIRLPSKQDNAVWLDTYRFGILRPINDEAEFFAGVDSYRNAIFAIDTSGDIAHRFGAAVGEGYAVKYELRLNL